MEIVSGDVTMKLDNELFSQSKRSTATAPSTKKPHQLLIKCSMYFPEKVSFSLPKLDVRCVNQEHDLFAENNVTGIILRSIKSKSVEDAGEITRRSVQMELNEIHLFREAESSILEVIKVDVVSSFEIPIQPVLPINANIKIELGGTQCNLVISRLEPWLSLLSPEKRTLVLQEQICTREKLKADDVKTIMWTCTFSAPEMTVMLCGIDDMPLYHFCSQSSHVFGNNISSIDTAIDVELGELNFHLADEYQQCYNEHLPGTEPNSGLLMHIEKISLNWARGGCRNDLVLSVSVTTMRIYLSYKRVESLITNAVSFEALFKKLSVSGERTNETGGVEPSHAPEKETRLVNLTLTRFIVNLCDATGLDNTVTDSVSLELTWFSFSLNKDKHSTEMELSRAKAIYQLYRPCSKVTLFDMHNAKLTRRSVRLDVHFLLSATDISLGWEPDVHLSLYRLFLRLRPIVYAQTLEDYECMSGSSVDEETRREIFFAIDVESLTISAKVGDGVEVKFDARSIFTENAFIGMLVEELMLALNGSRVLKTTRMQISRVPTVSLNLSDDIVPVRTSGPWDWVVQGLDVNICMPYRLQLRAIADSIEEKLRDLELITAAEEESLEPKNSIPGFGRLRFYIRRLNAYIEEEPIQGWLDEHYQLLKKETCELAVRLKFLEDFIQRTGHRGGVETSNGEEIDVHDPLAINKLKEEIQKRSFRSYYQACQGLVPEESSGACREGFQAGFRSSSARNSLLSVCATDFDLSLTAVRYGDDDDEAGLMEVLRNMDPSCEEISGSKVNMKTGSLMAKLRNYTLPLLSASSCTCEGHIVTYNPIAQQPQISQDVFEGSGPTPPVKTYSDLSIYFEQGDVSFGVGYEPAFADISYAITVALSQRNPNAPQVSKEERSLPWWDNMRNHVHGNISLSFSVSSKWNVLATTDPYQSEDKLQILTGPIEFHQSDGRVVVNAKDFKIKLSSLDESLISRQSLNVPGGNSRVAFFEAPVFNLDVTTDWGSSLNVLDPLRSASLSLGCHLSLRPNDKNEVMSPTSPTMNLGAQDLAWILKFCRMYSDPPNKLHSFSGRPRFGVVPRVVVVSEGLSLDQVMTEFMVRVDATPFLIKYTPSDLDDPAKGLIFDIKKLKYELCYSRGKQKYTLECKRDALDLVYQGLDVHVPKTFIKKHEHKGDEKNRDAGFLLSCDYITIRRQAPKADIERLLAWQKAGRSNLEVTYLRSEFENGSESDEHVLSDPSDDDGYNVVLSDNCQRVFVYGLKLLWTIENRDAVFSFVSGISKVFEPAQPSPSRQHTQRKILERNQENQEEISTSSASSRESQTVTKVETSGSDEEGTSHFMVNVIEPQFNLHSEEANGRFLLAAGSGRVIARSFQSIMRVGAEVIQQALGTTSLQSPKSIPEMTWTRLEFSVMLEHVQAHVALTDVDPSAGVQWLPNIRRHSPKLKRIGALLERVFMPCDMYLRYTRHDGLSPDLKVKPLEEITFNSRNIAATMTSRQFQVMMDVLTILLFPATSHKSSLHFPTEDDDIDDEIDEVVPYGIEEVELAKINLEEKEWEQRLILDDIRILSHHSDNVEDMHVEKKGDLWMISTRKSILVQRLKKELLYVQKSRKTASASLRIVLQKAANLRLMEKNRSAPYAMRISLEINEVVWCMLVDGRAFAEAKINNMTYDFDRDYKDTGVARFTTKSFVVRNCLCNAKSDEVLSAWNPPPEWGKKFMLRVDAKQGTPKDGNPLDLFHVEIYPLRIQLSETMYKMMWEYFFPEEEQDSQRRPEVWKVSTTTGSKRVKRQLESNVERVQKSTAGGSADQELRRTSSFDRNWEESVAESVANELLLQSYNCAVSSSNDHKGESSRQMNFKNAKTDKPRSSSHREKKARKKQVEMIKFNNIKISQVELLVTYEGSRFVVEDLRLLMDKFSLDEFAGTWRGLFARVKKHITCGVLKSVIGMQGKKFTYKSQYKSQENAESSDDDLKLSDNDESGVLPKKIYDESGGAGDNFVTSVRGLFNTQRRKPKAFVLRTMRGEADNDFNGEWSDSDVEFSPFARQLTITEAKRLIRRHTKKSRPISERGSMSQQRESLPLSVRETDASESSYSSESSPYEDFSR
nr:PREDICTED: protein SABRE-like isoform X1 [Raphanus sativus]